MGGSGGLRSGEELVVECAGGGVMAAPSRHMVSPQGWGDAPSNCKEEQVMTSQHHETADSWTAVKPRPPAEQRITTPLFAVETVWKELDQLINTFTDFFPVFSLEGCATKPQRLFLCRIMTVNKAQANGALKPPRQHPTDGPAAEPGSFSSANPVCLSAN
ncbi:hypothetical protein FQA47_003993 [Oryzias melastigma]|uniref:Uncharacterized protein n=1 Tax=Oryzias melastigma TaxID=30732 RepID=A0A834F381_ORYME|nr:hypothetical protein FQA47_003993 [Oryzias melastigma]